MRTLDDVSLGSGDARTWREESNITEGGKVLVLVLLLAVLGYVNYRTFCSKLEVTAPLAAAGADDLANCPNGTVECPNNCLKREAEGWRPMDVPGHPPTDIWMQFMDVSGRRVAFNQNHIGHVIQPVNGQYTDTGVCPVCRGRTRVCKE
jgi:hypothetical protein